MIRCSAYAPHLGAAIGAALMAAALLAFSAGERAAPAHEAPPPAPPIEPLQTAQSAAPAHDALSEPAEPPATTLAPARAMLAVIIDDVGIDRAAAERLMDRPVTLAILPYALGAPELARAAGEAGREVFVHLPMEPGGLDDPGPWALSRSHDAHAVEARVRWAFARVPGAAGFNNHMGSGFTADRAAMDRVFAALAGHHDRLVFVDSLTGPRSIAARAAGEAGFSALRRDVFLDVVRDEDAISEKLEEALALAAARGHAIAIGHPYRETLAVLETLEARAAAHGVELVSVSALAARLEAGAPS
ncbi:MAG: divergent polysaccharide deacetylase family protein [Oceanicaulis sp.]|nr:divergent polysaccharide deacetylase family protein [Oceanicaulis sp.]